MKTKMEKVSCSEDEAGKVSLVFTGDGATGAFEMKVGSMVNWFGRDIAFAMLAFMAMVRDDDRETFKGLVEVGKAMMPDAPFPLDASDGKPN